MPADNVAKMDIDLDWTGTTKSIHNFNREWLKSMRKVEKDSDKSMKGAGKAVSEFYHKSQGAQQLWSKEVVKANNLMNDLRGSVASSVSKISKLNIELSAQSAELKSLESSLRDYAKQGKNADASAVEAAKNRRNELKERISGTNKSIRDAERLVDVQKSTIKEIGEQKTEIEEKFTFDKHEMVEAAQAAGEEYVSTVSKWTGPAAEVFSAALSKDIPGMARSLGELGGKLFVAVTEKGLGIKFSKWGDKLLAKAASMHAKGAANKAAGGAGPGLAMKGMEKVIGSLGSMLKDLPAVMGLLNATVVGLVKLFIDAEATVKGINKEILATTSTAGVLRDNFGNADLAAASLDDTLKKISTAALSLDNLGWGISKDEHTAVISSLTAEGVSLKTLGNEYGELNKKTKSYSDSFGSITQMAVTYSRQMGVSLQEVTQLQGEMMTEMGSSLGTVQEAFHQMSMSALDSGIAGNKFFAMIRGVSSDLNLYNTRMEDTVKLLGQLGKIMSPRSAQQFMQFSMNAMKGMDRSTRLQTSLLAGSDFTKSRVMEDIADKQKDLEKDLADASGMDPKDIAKAVGSKNEEDLDSIVESIRKKSPEKGGTISEAVDRYRMHKQMAGGDQFSVAQEAGEMNPASQAEMVVKAATKFGGVGSIGGEMMAQQMGISHDQLEQMGVMNKGMEKQRKLLKAGLKDGSTQAKLAKVGVKISENAPEAEKQIAALSWNKITGTMDTAAQEDQKKQEEAMKAEADAAKHQGMNVQTISQKLEILIDWFMGQFYNVIMDIYEAIATSKLLHPGGGGGKVQDTMLLRAIQGIKDPAVQKATIAASKSGPGQAGQAFKDALMSDPTWTKMVDFMGQAQKDPKEESKRQKMIASSLDSMSDEQAKTAFAQSKGSKSFDEMDDTLKTSFENVLNMRGKGESLSSLAPQALGQDVATTMATKLGWSSGNDRSGQTAFAGEFAKLSGLMSPTEDTAAATTQLAKDGAPGKHSISVHDWHAEQALKDMVPGPTGMDTPEPTDADEDTADSAEETNGTLDKIYKALRNRGIKIEKFVGDHVKDTMHDAVLDAANEALLDYYMLQKAGPDVVAKAVKSGMSPSTLMKAAMGGDESLATATDAQNAQKSAKGNASGGLVTGIMDGMAQIKAAPGEGLASVGKGETITPVGGGGGGTQKIELSLKGDLARIIDARADDRYAVNRSREKFR